MVSPTNRSVVEDKLKRANLAFSVVIENVQKLIDEEKVPIDNETEKMGKSKRRHPMDWKSYHSQDDMEAYMDYLVKKYPKLASTEVIGTSYENRTMRILRICKGGTCGNKPAMWIDAGIHAREWVTPATATYMMKELVENNKQYPSKITDLVDWYILPVLNPDGYEYTRTTDRLWRKNRYTFSRTCFFTTIIYFMCAYNRFYELMFNHFYFFVGRQVVDASVLT
jgi:murein tripeptide amidase MpaA